MARLKLTETELKKQKDALKRFQRYLPLLQLREQQLQLSLRQVKSAFSMKQMEQAETNDYLLTWVDVFGQHISISQYIQIDSLVIEQGNLAGVEIPIFKQMTFKKIPYSLFDTPPWVDKAIDILRRLVRFETELNILQIQREKLEEELRITSQRINLFEKIKIPEAAEHIRKIRIYLGDQQTAARVRDKICKKKIRVQT